MYVSDFDAGVYTRFLTVYIRTTDVDFMYIL